MSRRCKTFLTDKHMKPEKKLVNVRMSERLAAELTATAAETDKSQSQFIREAVKEKVVKERQLLAAGLPKGAKAAA